MLCSRDPPPPPPAGPPPVSPQRQGDLCQDKCPCADSNNEVILLYFNGTHSNMVWRVK